MVIGDLEDGFLSREHQLLLSEERKNTGKTVACGFPNLMCIRCLWVMPESDDSYVSSNQQLALQRARLGRDIG